MRGVPPGHVCTLPEGSVVCVVAWPHMGMGFMAHALSGGVVPWVT